MLSIPQDRVKNNGEMKIQTLFIMEIDSGAAPRCRRRRARRTGQRPPKTGITPPACSPAAPGGPPHAARAAWGPRLEQAAAAEPPRPKVLLRKTLDAASAAGRDSARPKPGSPLQLALQLGPAVRPMRPGPHGDPDLSRPRRRSRPVPRFCSAKRLTPHPRRGGTAPAQNRDHPSSLLSSCARRSS